MRKYTRQVVLLALAVLVLTVAGRLLTGSTRQVSLPYNPPGEGESLPVPYVDDPEILRLENVRYEPGRFVFDVVPLKQGSALVGLRDSRGGDFPENIVFSVDRFQTLYNENTGSFTGDTVVMIGLTAFLLVLSAIMLHGYLSARGPAFYAYSTVFYIGFFFFALITGLTMLLLTVSHLARPDSFSMLNVYSSLSGASTLFMQLTAPLLLVFCAALAVSNLALLRHNRPRIQNLLGMLLAFLILAGGAFGFWLSGRDFSGSVTEYRIQSAIENVYSTVFVYFECILAGAVVCAFRAARRQPPLDRDIIIILGCWFRKDGTLPPLLRGRVDRAVAYWREHLRLTGREAWIIPSGGRGPDEPMPEAEAMKAYLLQQGIPERVILPETRSANTLQNLSFSRKIMEDNGLSGPVIFSTTNYHVFRSGLWAVQAGLRAEGIGSRTRWWFWPNAFVREWIGLIANRWKQELVLLLLMAGFFALLSLTIIG